MKLHEQLKSLYASQWDALKYALQAIAGNEQAKVKPAYPFLLSLNRWIDGMPTESWYTDADLKVMVFGQETNRWVGTTDDFGTPPNPVFSAEISVEAVMGIYEDFYASHYEAGRFKYNGRRYGTFHYGVNRFSELLNVHRPGVRVSYLWNNIVKLGKSQGAGFCGNEIYEVDLKHISVIRQEIELLQPDVLLFLTGSYDGRIRDKLGEMDVVALSDFTESEVARIRLSGIDVPAYRTYHPSARLPKGKMEVCYQAIMDDWCKRFK